jgi:hypothetical protein
MIHVFWTYIYEEIDFVDVAITLPIDGGKIYKKYQELIDKRISCKGKKWTCEHFKQLHSAAERIATGRPFTPIPWTKVDKNGIPIELLSVYPLLTSKYSKYKRFGLTITRSYQKIHVEPVLDTTSIEGESDARYTNEDLNKFK